VKLAGIWIIYYKERDFVPVLTLKT